MNFSPRKPPVPKHLPASQCRQVAPGRKLPVAPAVYRPQVKRAGVQLKAVTPLPVKRLPTVPPPAGPTRPTGPTVQQLAQRRTAQMKPVPAKAPSPIRNGPTPIQLKIAATRIPVNRTTTGFVRSQAIQLYIVRDLERCYARQPTGAEQLAVHRKIVAALAGEPDRFVGGTMEEARSEFARLVLEKVGGGAPSYETRMMAYLLGKRDDEPAAQVSGLGSLKADDDGLLSGRSGFLKAAFSRDEITGAPGRAFRHRSAWHNIKHFLNAIREGHGPGEIERLYHHVSGGVSDGIAAEAEKTLAKHHGKPEYPMLWLGVVTNSARPNLWLGPARENISINSSAFTLKRWTNDLDMDRISVEKFKSQVRGARFRSAKAKHAKTVALRIIDEGQAKADPKTYIVQQMNIRCVSMLEVDLPDEHERESAPHHMRLYEISRGIGGLDDREEIMDDLLGMEGAARRRRSRSRSPVRGGGGGRSRSPLRSPVRRPVAVAVAAAAAAPPLPPAAPPRRAAAAAVSHGVRRSSRVPAVRVASMDEAMKRPWNKGDMFQLPNENRFQLRSNHIGGVPWVEGDLQAVLVGG